MQQITLFKPQMKLESKWPHFVCHVSLRQWTVHLLCLCICGVVGPLMHTVTLMITSTAITFNLIDTLTMNLANLRHSVTYRVQVVAENEAGVAPAAEVVFRTDDTG